MKYVKPMLRGVDFNAARTTCLSGSGATSSGAGCEGGSVGCASGSTPSSDTCASGTGAGGWPA